MPQHITDTSGKKVRLWTDEEVQNRYRQGLEDAGKKVESFGRYSEEELKTAFNRGKEKSDRLVSAAARAGFEEGFKEGKINGRDDAMSRIQEQKQYAEKKGYDSGFKEGEKIAHRKSYEEGLDFGKRIIGKEQYEAGYKQGKEDAADLRKSFINNTQQRFRMFQTKLPNANMLSFPKKTLLYIAAPIAAGFFVRQLSTSISNAKATYDRTHPKR